MNSGLADFDDNLAEIFPFKQAREPLRSIFQAVDNVLVRLYFTLIYPGLHSFEEGIVFPLSVVVVNNETFNSQAFYEGKEKRIKPTRRAALIGPVVMCNQAAHRNTSVHGHER